MQVTLCSFLSAIVWFSVLVAGVYLLRKKLFRKRYIGVFTITLLYLFSIIRAFLPIEIPNVIVLGGRRIYPYIYRFLTAEHVIAGFSVSVLSVCLVIWIVGACLKMVKFSLCYHNLAKSIRDYAVPCGDEEQKMLRAVKQEVGTDINVMLVTMPKVKIPFGFGVFHKWILIPDGHFSDKQLYYFLLHEYTHFVHKDTVIKLFVQIFGDVFWWNPVAYLVKRDFEQVLEMRCDEAILKRVNHAGRIAYGETIVSILKSCSESEEFLYTSTALSNAAARAEIKERFSIMFRADEAKMNKKWNVGFLCVFILLILVSYKFIPQPRFEYPDSEVTEAVDYDVVNSYIKKMGNGEYWLYVEGKAPLKVSTDEVTFYESIGFRVVKG